MLQKIGKLIKSILFIGLAAGVFCGITIITLPKIPDFYQEEEWDVVFFGTSQSYCTFDPLIFSEYGLHTYNRGRQQQTMNYTYYYIKDAFDVSKIDVVVLEMFGMFYDEGDDRFTDASIRESSLGDFRYSDIKMEMIRDCVPKDLQFEYLFPLDKYHANWEKWDFSSAERFRETVFSPYYKESSDNGYSRWTGSEPAYYPEWEELHSGYYEEVYEENLRYLEMIRKLCIENGAELVLVKAPFPCYDMTIGKTNTMIDWAIAHDVDYINFMTMYEIIDLNTDTDSLDGGAHLNERGAAKVSRYLAEYLMEHYF